MTAVPAQTSFVDAMSRLETLHNHIDVLVDAAFDALCEIHDFHDTKQTCEVLDRSMVFMAIVREELTECRVVSETVCNAAIGRAAMVGSAPKKEWHVSAAGADAPPSIAVDRAKQAAGGAAPGSEDAEFWRLLAHEQRVRAQWMRSYVVMRDLPQCDAVTGRWRNRHNAAEQAVVNAPISTLKALWAKLDMIKVNEIEYDIQQPAYGGLAPQDLVLSDVMRMIVRCA